VVFSFYPWFDIDDDVVFEARLLGLWCLDEAWCTDDELLYWTPGPGDSYNLFEDDRLTHRAWLGEINGTFFLDFQYLCEPSRGTGDDSCHEGGVGSHIVARVTRIESDSVTFRLLNLERFKEWLELEEEPFAHGTPDDGLILVEETEALRDFLVQYGGVDDFWDEPTEMTRPE
jgi:hypothetical protein